MDAGELTVGARLLGCTPKPPPASIVGALGGANRD